MKPKIRKLWVDALLSGEYEQGGGILRPGTQEGTYRYCCLGVLHDQCVKAGVEGATWTRPHPGGRRSTIDIGQDMFLPRVTQDWAGTAGDADPAILRTRGGGEVSASHANDGLHWDFATIARALTGELTLTSRQLEVLNVVADLDSIVSVSDIRQRLFHDTTERAISMVCAALVTKGLLQETEGGWRLP